MKTFCLAAALAVAAVPLAGCTTMQRAGPTIAAVQARYDAARPYAELLLPYLSPERAARVRLALALVERGLAIARTATTVADQRAALATAEANLAAVEEPTG